MQKDSGPCFKTPWDSCLPPFEGQPLKLTIVFGTSNKAKDTDNLLKFIMDALQKVVYADYQMVHKLVVEKQKIQAPHGFTKVKTEAYTDDSTNGLIGQIFFLDILYVTI